MKSFNSLSDQEQQSLLEFPAYISLLAANADGVWDTSEKVSATELAHIKTYSGDPLLFDFFKKVDRTFKRTLERIHKALPAEKADREAAIKSKLFGLEKVLLKLGPDYTAIMHRSMESFKQHVSAAHHNVLIDFLFPIPIKGLSY